MDSVRGRVRPEAAPADRERLAVKAGEGRAERCLDGETRSATARGRVTREGHPEEGQRWAARLAATMAAYHSNERLGVRTRVS